ncbi:MAG: hypothetical protein LC734_05770, partial [Acidobacteria bacterium]|nr:hypothetical protein [Acidobacteriota bacterium]
LSERESAPLLSHLVDCSFCRHRTAELVRLDLDFSAESDTRAPQPSTATPSKIGDVLSGLVSRIFGTTDSTAFAHQETSEAEDKKEPERDKDS